MEAPVRPVGLVAGESFTQFVGELVTPAAGAHEMSDATPTAPAAITAENIARTRLPANALIVLPTLVELSVIMFAPCRRTEPMQSPTRCPRVQAARSQSREQPGRGCQFGLDHEPALVRRTTCVPRARLRTRHPTVSCPWPSAGRRTAPRRNHRGHPLRCCRASRHDQSGLGRTTVRLNVDECPTVSPTSVHQLAHKCWFAGALVR